MNAAYFAGIQAQVAEVAEELAIDFVTEWPLEVLERVVEVAASQVDRTQQAAERALEVSGNRLQRFGHRPKNLGPGGPIGNPLRQPELNRHGGVDAYRR